MKALYYEGKPVAVRGVAKEAYEHAWGEYINAVFKAIPSPKAGAYALETQSPSLRIQCLWLSPSLAVCLKVAYVIKL